MIAKVEITEAFTRKRQTCDINHKESKSESINRKEFSDRVEYVNSVLTECVFVANNFSLCDFTGCVWAWTLA